MSGFHTKTFTIHDDYMTPKTAWESIKHLIPSDKIIWESAYGDGNSGKYLNDLDFNVIHKPIDYFNDEPDEWDIQITNPPFTMKKEWFKRAKEFGKPFIILSPSSMINTKYIRELFSNEKEKLKILIPRQRIQFIKLVNGKIPEDFKPRCNFDCFYYCWKIDLQRDITWL
tara:strand:+ start:931 stop:1440 length:510 start_codon:yes stop_codon:yes gene_type:complete